MNIQEYILSGVIESYVLGLLSPEEEKEFELMCTRHPEITAARNDFELLLEKQLMSERLEAPQGILENILSTVSDTNTRIIPMKIQDVKQPPVRKMNVWKWVAAACILLFVFSLYYINSARDENIKLKNENLALKGQSIYRTPYTDLKLKPNINRPTIKWSAMIETGNTSHCMAHVYWDSLSKDTYLLLGNIPEPPLDKQYQLWALINDEQIDLGVLNIRKEGMLIQMKNVYNSKAFAITIEKNGGSSKPTMENLYAIGKL